MTYHSDLVLAYDLRGDENSHIMLSLPEDIICRN